MATIEITMNLPADLVTRAQKAGVLTTERLIAFLEKELEREYRVGRLFKTLDRLQAVKPAITPEELDAEIAAHRSEKRQKLRNQAKVG